MLGKLFQKSIVLIYRQLFFVSESNFGGQTKSLRMSTWSQRCRLQIFFLAMYICDLADIKSNLQLFDKPMTMTILNQALSERWLSVHRGVPHLHPTTFPSTGHIFFLGELPQYLVLRPFPLGTPSSPNEGCTHVAPPPFHWGDTPIATKWGYWHCTPTRTGWGYLIGTG